MVGFLLPEFQRFKRCLEVDSALYVAVSTVIRHHEKRNPFMRLTARGSRPDTGLAVCFLATVAVLSTLDWHFEPWPANPINGGADADDLSLGGGRLQRVTPGLSVGGRKASDDAGTAEMAVGGRAGGRCKKEDPRFCKKLSFSDCSARLGLKLYEVCPALCRHCSAATVAATVAAVQVPEGAPGAAARPDAAAVLSPGAHNAQSQLQPTVAADAATESTRPVSVPIPQSHPGPLPLGQQVGARPPARSCKTDPERSKVPSRDSWGDPASPCFLRPRTVALNPA